LLAIFHTFGGAVFLDFALRSVQLSLFGELQCWAFQYTESDPHVLLDKVRKADPELIDYVNQQAEFFECFPGHAKVGRAKLPSASQTRPIPLTVPSVLATASDAVSVSTIGHRQENSSLKRHEQGHKIRMVAMTVGLIVISVGIYLSMGEWR